MPKNASHEKDQEETSENPVNGVPGGENPEGESSEGERIFDWAVAQGYKILRMNRKRLSLEEIFVKLTNEVSQQLSNEVGQPLSNEEAKS
jgi:hypothetical protein